MLQDLKELGTSRDGSSVKYSSTFGAHYHSNFIPRGLPTKYENSHATFRRSLRRLDYLLNNGAVNNKGLSKSKVLFSSATNELNSR
jgi:hypothetical protein